MTDDERKAFHAWYLGLRDGEHTHYQAFAAGIAYAQKWRGMESAPKGWAVLLRDERGSVYVALWRHSEQEWIIIGGGGAIVIDPTGWLPLPPTEVK